MKCSVFCRFAVSGKVVCPSSRTAELSAPAWNFPDVYLSVHCLPQGTAPTPPQVWPACPCPWPCCSLHVACSPLSPSLCRHRFCETEPNLCSCGGREEKRVRSFRAQQGISPCAVTTKAHSPTLHSSFSTPTRNVGTLRSTRLETTFCALELGFIARRDETMAKKPSIAFNLEVVNMTG